MKQEVFFIRIPKDMYKEIERVAGEQQRSLTLQAQILIGAALNRGLVSGESPAQRQMARFNNEYKISKKDFDRHMYRNYIDWLTLTDEPELWAQTLSYAEFNREFAIYTSNKFSV